MQSYQSRRKFITTAVSGVIASAIAPSIVFGKAVEQSEMKKSIFPEEIDRSVDSLRLAIFGVNSQSESLFEIVMKQPDVSVVALCDPDLDVLKVKAKWFEDTYKQQIAVEQDYRKINADKNIDALIIAIPNHWHSLHAIYAYQADIDMCFEKPAIRHLRNKLIGRAGAFQIVALPFSQYVLSALRQRCGF